jgi:hypothetical protein
VANVPKAPVSNSLALKNPEGGETAGIDDVTGCPPKAAIAREVNITVAKEVSLFIFAFLHSRCGADGINRRYKGFLQGGWVRCPEPEVPALPYPAASTPRHSTAVAGRCQEPIRARVACDQKNETGMTYF